MSPILAAALYFILWWLVLFVVLPIGVRTQEEAGNIVPGSVPSAPLNPNLKARLVITTIVSGMLFGAGAALWWSGFVTLDSIPFLPEFPALGEPS